MILCDLRDEVPSILGVTGGAKKLVMIDYSPLLIVGGQLSPPPRLLPSIGDLQYHTHAVQLYPDAKHTAACTRRLQLSASRCESP